MNETAMRPSIEEPVIDFRQLCYFVLKKWKVLLIALLAGVVLGTGISLMQGEKTLESFDMSELDAVRIQQYALYNQLYQDRLTYDRGSLLTHMDPNTAYTGTLRYYVAASAASIDLISTMFQNIIYDESLWLELKDAGQLEVDPQYIQELVGLSVSRREEANIQLTSPDDLTRIPASAIISVDVLADGEEACDGMMQVLRERVAAVDAECKAAYAQYHFLPLTDMVAYGYSNDLVDKQKSAASLKYDYITQMKTLESQLSQDELDYFSLAYPDLSGRVAKTSFMSMLKYPVLLAALFFFLTAGAYAVTFITDNRVKTAAELRDAYGLRLIASLPSDRPARRGIDGWLDRLANKSAFFNNREYLLNALQVMDAQRILLCGDPADRAVRDTMEWLAAQDHRICYGGLLACDSQALTDAKASDAVVLFARLWRTTRQQVEMELEISRSGRFPTPVVITVEP